MKHKWKTILAFTLTAAMVIVSGCGAATPASNRGGSSSNAKATTTPVKKEEPWAKGPVTIDFWHIQASIYGDSIKEMVACLTRSTKVKLSSKRYSKAVTMS